MTIGTIATIAVLWILGGLAAVFFNYCCSRVSNG